MMPSFWLYAVCLVLVGLAALTFLNSCQTTIQLTVEPQFRGRVLSLYLAFLQGGIALGAPLMGWIGTEFGGRWSVASGGLIVLAAGLAALILISRRSGVKMREQVRSISIRNLFRKGRDLPGQA